MQFKKPRVPFFFKRLSRRSNGRNNCAGSVGAGDAGGVGGSGKWRFNSFSPGLRWKRRFTMHWFVDGFLFKIVSVLEAIILVLSLCFFYLFCGCHI
ncbi:hypothetical protein ACH5RR_015501 [Cinchona calisaya]|uniref:Transmembrane protein n=1 Tax=Cinchona calisaya TaxID=153742 RepID=A0ABD2ZW10_9GENT